MLQIWLAAPGAASAQGEPKGYREAIDLALSEYDAGNFAEARAGFRRAHTLFPNARSLRAIGMAEYELRNYAECIPILEEALSSSVRALDAALRAETEALLAKARNYVARLTLELQPSAATVVVNGVPAALGAGNTLVLNVGDHVVEFSADACVPERREIHVNGGELATLHVHLRSAAGLVRPSAPAGDAHTVTPSNDASAASSQRSRLAPWLVTGAGVLVAVAGSVLVALAQKDIAKVENAADGTPWSDLKGAYNAAPVKSGVGIAMLGVGVAGIATGLGLVWRRRQGQKSSTLALSPGRISVAGNF